MDLTPGTLGGEKVGAPGKRGSRRRRTELPRDYKSSGAYKSWLAMRGRCLRPYDPSYERYGGRGITICDRWDDFALFLQDMGARPPGYSLDRVDPDGNYEAGNCRWATALEQRHNRSRFLRPDQIPIDQRWPGDWDEIRENVQPRTPAGSDGDNPSEQP